MYQAQDTGEWFAGDYRPGAVLVALEPSDDDLYWLRAHEAEQREQAMLYRVEHRICLLAAKRARERGQAGVAADFLWDAGINRRMYAGALGIALA